MVLGKHHLLTLNNFQDLALNEEKQASVASEGKKLLDILQRSIQFDAAWIFKFDPSSLNISDIYLHQFSQEAFSKYLDTFYTETPIPTIHQIQKDGYIAKRGSDIVETAVWLKNPFYQDVLHPLGLKFFLVGACVDQKKQFVGLIVLWRSKHRYDFSGRDSVFLQHASLSCATILSRTRSTEDDLEKPEILRLITQHSEPGVIILGKDDEIGLMNQEAKTILSIIRSGREHLARTSDERFFRKLRQLRSRVLNETFLPKQNGSSSPPSEIFRFRGTTFSCKGILLDGSGRDEGLVMILIEAMSEETEVSPVFNKRFSVFTAREGAIAKLISQGYTNKEIAADLGIGIYTVKDHIRHIMEKLGTNTRSGIVGKIMVRSAPDPHAH
ncbi:MAG TPA: helix-turn-helix transcriptional regulator [Nitrospiria bacterium]|nr:helix-turn-helix transcriptional regulator [Nitrospiria bacterium]